MGVGHHLIGRGVDHHDRAAHATDLRQRVHPGPDQPPRDEGVVVRGHLGDRGETRLDDQPRRFDLGGQIHGHRSTETLAEDHDPLGIDVPSSVR